MSWSIRTPFALALAASAVVAVAVRLLVRAPLPAVRTIVVPVGAPPPPFQPIDIHVDPLLTPERARWCDPADLRHPVPATFRVDPSGALVFVDRIDVSDSEDVEYGDAPELRLEPAAGSGWSASARVRVASDMAGDRRWWQAFTGSVTVSRDAWQPGEELVLAYEIHDRDSAHVMAERLRIPPR